MIRLSTLLPALVVAFGLASGGGAMASGPSADATMPDHAKDKATQTAEESIATTGSANAGATMSSQAKDDATQAASGCDSAPRYEEPAYCGPNHGH
jgi:hypothetical protein